VCLISQGLLLVNNVSSHLPFWHFPNMAAGAGVGQGTYDIIQVCLLSAAFGLTMPMPILRLWLLGKVFVVAFFPFSISSTPILVIGYKFPSPAASFHPSLF